MKSIAQKIADYNNDRLPEFLAYKYNYLRSDPFRFFRGTCHLFYEDLAGGMTWKDPSHCWITGDLHLENFGTYKGDDKVVYFDMNDFDEACLAPASWELARLLTSIHLAAKSLKLGESSTEELCKLCTDTYIATLQRGKPWVVDKGTAKAPLHYLIANLELRKRSAFLKARTRKDKNIISLRIDKVKTFPLAAAIKNTILQNATPLLSNCPQLKDYNIIDTAFRLAGTGSVGLERYVLLLQHGQTGKLRLVDMKEARPSSLAPWVAMPQPGFKNEAERISTVQHFVQHVAPSLLQATKMGAKHYVLKALQPTQDRMDLQLCRKKPAQLQYMIAIMARLAASGHLRSGGRAGSSITDELIAFADNAADWKDALNTYARNYASKVMSDYEDFCRAMPATRK